MPSIMLLSCPYELDHLFEMAYWAEPAAFAAKCQKIFMVAIRICAPAPGEAFLKEGDNLQPQLSEIVSRVEKTEYLPDP